MQPVEVQPGAFLQCLAAVEQPPRELVLALCNRLPWRLQAVTQRELGEPQQEAVRVRRRGRVEQRIKAQVKSGRAFPALTPPQEVAVEIDIVLIRASRPRHAVGVEHVRQHQRAAGGRGGQAFECGQLHRGSGVSYHAMKPARVQQNAARITRPEARDVDGQGFLPWPPRFDAERIKRSTCGARRATETLARGGVIGREEGFKFQVQSFKLEADIQAAAPPT
ncbi:hypothetical protein D3C83_03400 [compost metagenome]